jgi:hypothetical protein
VARPKAFGELPDQLVRPVSSAAFIGFPLERKAEYHERPDKDPTNAPLSHSGAKGPAHLHGHFSL